MSHSNPKWRIIHQYFNLFPLVHLQTSYSQYKIGKYKFGLNEEIVLNSPCYDLLYDSSFILVSV